MPSAIDGGSPPERLLVMIRSILAAAVSLIAVSAPAHAQTQSPWCASGKPVKFAGITWESGMVLTALMRHVMEHGYGCKTEELPGNSVTMEAALATNDVQVFAEEWIGRSEAWNKAAAAGKVKAVGNVIVGATEGWYVPEYVVTGDPKRNVKAAAPDLKQTADLAKLPGRLVLRGHQQPEDEGLQPRCELRQLSSRHRRRARRGHHLGSAARQARPLLLLDADRAHGQAQVREAAGAGL
jgi:hypothetical protein